ncbi:prenyltransferase/squalene oxidase repeat-containing protein [Streptomyces sp. TLI_105]|uniref:prenyltransferase/squalene oxidase repeat-containing protein n=1 Tax=Streptomyces sp. TLI_105 TaxID=1881019 RepID=UPI00089ADDF9|nr:prenyltransferase/squalene oxidase repeat-containing protein [Streptomyces sp. TLI_105]SED48082.1 Prenyltransferase and squalene oxidase repeat-containing protein [Streptomyces sp. TLI_105]
MNTVRRGAAALAAAAVVLGTAAAGAASAAPSPSPSTGTLPSGLYGTKDPTYDGVWRQSLAFLAQRGTGYQPADRAVDWLLGQQCADGSFASYRADVSQPCDAKTMRDTNATAVAVQALRAVRGQAAAPEAIDKAVKAGSDWLRSVQNKDGGWGYGVGGASDANSTSVVVGALAAIGVRPVSFTSAEGRTPYDALLTFALPCSDKEGAGAFAYQPDKTGKLLANADATAAATLAGLGKSVVATKASPEQPPTCTDLSKPTVERAALNGASYLSKALAKTGHLTLPPMPGATDTTEQPDIGNTADAVVALAAAGAAKETEPALAWLEKNSAAWAKEGGPAAYAQLILAARATDTDPREFGTADLVEQLNATGPAPKTPDTSASSTSDEAGSGFDVWWIIGIGTLVGVGVGFLVSGRKK